MSPFLQPFDREELGILKFSGSSSLIVHNKGDNISEVEEVVAGIAIDGLKKRPKRM